jgi:hypothetical protein
VELILRDSLIDIGEFPTSGSRVREVGFGGSQNRGAIDPKRPDGAANALERWSLHKESEEQASAFSPRLV